ncbi:flagellin [candidate division KSB1 bacterium]|nr:MAG: flagellin [candidate division KSB1 bacterium]
MALRIQHNIASMYALRNLGISTNALEKSLERLSSGYRINHAGDDTSGLAVSQKFRAQIASLKVASRNAAEANSLLQVAEGGIEQIHSMLVRLKELATQAASTNAGSNRTEINQEAQALVSEIDRIATSTEYADVDLLTGYGTKSVDSTSQGEINDFNNLYDFDVTGAATGSYTFTYNTTTNVLTLSDGTTSDSVTLATGANSYEFSTLGVSFKTTAALDTGAEVDALGTGLAALNNSGTADFAVSGSASTFQIGFENSSDNRLSIQLDSVKAEDIGSSASTARIDDIDLSTQSGAQTALGIIDDAISDVSNARGDIGAYMNRLAYASANIAISIENLQQSESVIRDADMAEEMATFTKSQILQQAGVAMLAQANTLPQSALQLLR